MNILVVGGTFCRPSSVITKLCNALKDLTSDKVIEWNGHAPPTSIKGYDLVLWFPDIDNEKEKSYPHKDIGSVLICSKVMRKETTRADAVSRIFKMQANAVLAITKHKSGFFSFELIDALNNSWHNTQMIQCIAEEILKLYHWTKESKRKSLKRAETQEFLQVNKELANSIATSCGDRFFGNLSTRCRSLFPTQRAGELFLFSPRNSDKKTLTEDDLVLTSEKAYIGTRKPSVDAPVQLEIYKQVPEIKYMIHGHAFIKFAPTTKDYYPCGDLREVDNAVKLIKNQFFAINLKKHGFLLAATSLSHLKKLIAGCKFYM